jgi:hypothetical protein
MGVEKDPNPSEERLDRGALTHCSWEKFKASAGRLPIQKAGRAAQLTTGFVTTLLQILRRVFNFTDMFSKGAPTTILFKN